MGMHATACIFDYLETPNRAVSGGFERTGSARILYFLNHASALSGLQTKAFLAPFFVFSLFFPETNEGQKRK